MALNLRLSLTISGFPRATPRSSKRAFMASSLFIISYGTFGSRPGRLIDGWRTAKINCSGMTYRKFKADYLFTGELFAGSQMVSERDGLISGEATAKEEMVLVTNAEGTVQAVVQAAEAGEGIESYSGMLSPGFVNCH